jgi:hypothetical protein
VVEPPQAIALAPTWRIWAGQQRTRTQRLGGRLRGRCSVRRSGGHEEGLRRTRGEAAGEQLGTTSADRCMVNAGTLSGSPFPLASQAGGGQARCRLLALGGDGAAVVVRGRESRPHGEGRQQVRSVGTGRPGGRRLTPARRGPTPTRRRRGYWESRPSCTDGQPTIPSVGSTTSTTSSTTRRSYWLPGAGSG